MSKKRKISIALHNQILIALLLGAIFGAIFSVSDEKIDIKYLNDSGVSSKVKVEDWQSFRVIGPEESKEFGPGTQSRIVKYSDDIKGRFDVEIRSNSGREIRFSQVSRIKRVETVATYIKPLGDLFIRLLSFLAIPLVIATLISGAASLGDIRKLGRIGSRTFVIYVFTTVFAITVGVVATNVLRPGDTIPDENKQELMDDYRKNAEESEAATEDIDIDLVNFFVEIVPKNPFKAIAEGNMLQLIFFAVMFGITLTFIEPAKTTQVTGFFEGMSEVMVRMVVIIMKIAPYGVFALIAATVAAFGYKIMLPLLGYMGVVVLGLLLQVLVVYSLILKGLGRVSVLEFFKKVKEAQVIAFSTSSSAATLPVTMKCAEKMGVKKEISGFVLPLGATINMDGTALYQGVAAIFISQVYGMDLSIAQQLTIILTAVLASIGTAPVPGVGIIMLVMILHSVGIPAEGIALILGVDRILDMLRTVANITGDTAVAIAVGNMENRRNQK